MSRSSPLPTTRPVRVFFERVLLPYRSLPPRGFHLLMLVLGADQPRGRDRCSCRSAPGRSAGFSASTSRWSTSPSAVVSQRPPARDAAPRRRRIHRRARRHSRRPAPMALPAVLGAGDLRGARRTRSNRLSLASHGQTPADRRPSCRRRCGASWPATLRDALARWRAALNPTQRQADQGQRQPFGDDAQRPRVGQHRRVRAFDGDVLPVGARHVDAAAPGDDAVARRVDRRRRHRRRRRQPRQHPLLAAVERRQRAVDRLERARGRQAERAAHGDHPPHRSGCALASARASTPPRLSPTRLALPAARVGAAPQDAVDRRHRRRASARD